MTIRYERGDLLAAPVEAVVNTVNTRGVMGKGIALQVKQRWPEVDRAYRAASKRGEVTLGHVHIVELGGLGDGPRFVINFPTKDHWRSGSKLSDIEAGLIDLRTVIEKLGLHSIAIPPLGCGNGGLDWADVRPLIEAELGPRRCRRLRLPPEGRPPRPDGHRDLAARMTPTLAGLVRLLDAYWADMLGITDIEVQKLAYFLGVRRPALQLHFAEVRTARTARTFSSSSSERRVTSSRATATGAGGPGNLALSKCCLVPSTKRTSSSNRAALMTTSEPLPPARWFRRGVGPRAAEHGALGATEPDGATDPTARERISRWSTRKNRIFPASDIDDAWSTWPAARRLTAPARAPELFEA